MPTVEATEEHWPIGNDSDFLLHLLSFQGQWAVSSLGFYYVADAMRYMS